MNVQTTFDQGDITLKKANPGCYLCIFLCFDVPITIWLWETNQILPPKDPYTDPPIPYSSAAEFCGIDALLWLRIYFTTAWASNFYTVIFILFFTKPAPGGSATKALAELGCMYSGPQFLVALFYVSWLIYGFAMQISDDNRCSEFAET